MEKNICMKGYHHHPGHPKSNKDGCMKNEDMEKIKENYGSLSIYNTVRCFSKEKSNNTTSYIGI